MNYTYGFDHSFFFEGISGLLAFNVLVGLPANVYVVWLIVSESGGSVVSEIFALNLAISEILFGCSSLYVIVHLLLGMSLGIGALVLQLFLGLMLMSRPVFQTCICLERYLAVVHPTLFIRFKPLRYRLLSCGIDWLLILLDSTFAIFFPAQRLLSAYFSTSKCVVFFLILSYCGIRVLLVLKQPGPGDGGRSAENWNSMKRKAFKVIMITLVFNSTTQLLQVIMLAPALLQPSLKLALEVTLVSMAITILSSFITPLLYLHRAGKLPCIKF